MKKYIKKTVFPVVAWVKKTWSELIIRHRTSAELARAFSVGIYIAISPFLFFHTIMAFLFAWGCSLNLAAVLATTHGLNNPWTMVTIYAADYFFGHWLLRGVCGIDPLSLDPCWVRSLNETLTHYTGVPNVAMSSFLIGGNLLAVLISVILYPVIRYFCFTCAKQMHRYLPGHATRDHEDNSAEQKSILRVRDPQQDRGRDSTER